MKIQFGDLENLFFSIQNIIEYIELSNYDNRRYKMFLSNGEYLNFSIPKNSIPHLLGINTNYLAATNIFNTNNSFELLKNLVENPYKIQNLERDGIISYDQLFSQFIIEKVNSFRENIKINLPDIEFICKYEPRKTYKISNESKNYDYLIVKKLANERYGILCLVRNQGYFTPMSSQVFEDYETLIIKLKELIKYQEITLINGIEIFNTNDDYYSSHYLKLNDKAQKLHNLRNYKKDFDISIDVANDFEYSMKKIQQNIIRKDETTILIDKIVKSISNGEIIDINYYEGNSLLPIVNVFNNFICSIGGPSTNKNQETYSSLISRLKEFEEKIQTLESLNDKLLSVSDRQNEENEELRKENYILKDKQKKIYQILKPNN